MKVIKKSLKNFSEFDTKCPVTKDDDFMHST